MKTLAPMLTSPPATASPSPCTERGPGGERLGARRRSGALPLGGEAVADVAHGLDEDARARLDLAAQTADVDVDGAGAAEVLVAPDTVEQRLAREHLAAVRHQKAQQLELLEREAHRLLT